MEADTAAVGKVGGGVSVRIGRICRVKDIIRVSPLGAGDPSRVYQTCVQICFQNREMPPFPFVLSHSALQKKKSVGLHQIGTTEINLSHASFGDILYPPPSLTFLLFRFGLCVQSCVAQNATFLLQQPPLRPQVRGGGIGTLVHL